MPAAESPYAAFLRDFTAKACKSLGIESGVIPEMPPAQWSVCASIKDPPPLHEDPNMIRAMEPFRAAFMQACDRKLKDIECQRKTTPTA